MKILLDALWSKTVEGVAAAAEEEEEMGKRVCVVFADVEKKRESKGAEEK